MNNVCCLSNRTYNALCFDPEAELDITDLYVTCGEVSVAECLLIHLLGQLHVSFGAKLVQESVPTRSSMGTWRGRQRLSANSLPNLTVLTGSKKGPKLRHRMVEVQTMLDLEVCENDAQSSVESVCSDKRALSSEAGTSSYSSNPTLLHSEFGNVIERNLKCRVTSLEINFDQPDSSWHSVAANSDSGLPEKGDDMNDKIAAKHNASHGVAVARSKLHVLSSSDPNLLCSSEIGSAEKSQSALFGRLSFSGRAAPLSSSAPNLVPSCENGKSGKGKGFTLVKLKSKVSGWKPDCGTIFSALPSFLQTRSNSDQSTYKHLCKPRESEERLMCEEEIFRAPKLHRVMDPKDQDCGALVAVDTPSPAVIPRGRGAAQMQCVMPQELEQAANEQSLYDIEWSFPESGKKSCSNIAKFALTPPLSSDRPQLPHLWRPRSGPAYICKSLQQLCVLFSIL
jgi:hypothetical protein